MNSLHQLSLLSLIFGLLFTFPTIHGLDASSPGWFKPDRNLMYQSILSSGCREYYYEGPEFRLELVLETNELKKVHENPFRYAIAECPIQENIEKFRSDPTLPTAFKIFWQIFRGKPYFLPIDLISNGFDGYFYYFKVSYSYLTDRPLKEILKTKYICNNPAVHECNCPTVLLKPSNDTAGLSICPVKVDTETYYYFVFNLDFYGKTPLYLPFTADEDGFRLRTVHLDNSVH